MPLQYIDHDHRFPDLTFSIAFKPTIPALYIFWAAVVTPSTFLVFQPNYHIYHLLRQLFGNCLMVREGDAPARLAVAAAIRQFWFIIYTSCGAEAEWHARAGLVAAIHTISHSARTISCQVLFFFFFGTSGTHVGCESVCVLPC